MKFSDLNLIPPILKAAAEAGYEEPSPIQQKAIPPVLAGRDLLGCAQTGTGKTAAFAMPILQRLAAGTLRYFRRREPESPGGSAEKGRRYPDSHARPPERSHRTGLYRPEKC